MKLNDAQKKLLLAKLSEVKVKCHSCGGDNFTVLDKIFEIREFNEGNMVVGGDNSVIPMVVLTCNQCGEMRFLSALFLGLLDNSEKTVKKDVE